MAKFHIIFLFSLSLCLQVDGVPYITLQQGRLFGETVNFAEEGIFKEVDVFKGIPYAEPPARFSAPQPKQKWVGDWNATYHRPSCVQHLTSDWRPWFHPTVDEDCLYLNIYAPHPKPSNAPVMVYIHGGSYQTGTANTDDFSGLPLVAFENVITVIVNYRLNVFGFLSTGDSAATGNYGLLDQAEALRWVKENIHEFGGDQSRITIYGESAGAGSVDFHLFSKYSRDLFDQAILQSGTAIAFWSYQDNPEQQREQSFLLGETLSCNAADTDELIKCLHSVSAGELHEAYVKNGFSWIPNRDGVFLDESPHELLARRDFKECPLIVGFNRNEGSFAVPFAFPDYIGKKDPPYIDRAMFDIMTSAILQAPGKFTNVLIENAVKQEYVDWSQADNASADYFLTVLPIFGDMTFSCPALDIIRGHSHSMEPVFQYFMTHVPSTSYYERGDEGTGWLLTGHAEDIPFVFGWGFNPAIKGVHYWTQEEKELSRNVMRFWANFAKTGDPSKTTITDEPGTGDMEWPSFSVPDLYYKQLSSDMHVGRGIKADECAFWGDFLEDLRLTLGGVPYVTVDQGRLFGETVDFDEDGTSTKVDVFKGIPFAEPPVRFSAPQPKSAWIGDWDATYHRPSCVQRLTNKWTPWFNPTIDEDCLYLNIYVPNPKPSNASVMVYIHGGGYEVGSGNDAELSGLPIVAFEQVIIVLVNYRLNVFGFLSTGDSAAKGNYGLLDQAEALKWVRANIEEFGGDKSQITIYGESAGAGSVDFHLFSKHSRDSFDQAILQSGTATAYWSYLDDPDLQREQSFLLGKTLNCSATTTADLIECLRSVSSDELHEAYVKNGYAWMPNRDGVFLDESPHKLLARGDFKECPLIVGFNRDEGTFVIPFFFPDYLGKSDPPYIDRATFDFMTNAIIQFTGKFTNDLIENAVKQEYVDWSQADNASADYFLTVLPIYGDTAFSCAVLDIIRAHSYSKEPVFQYFFTHIPSMSYFERGGEGTGWFLAGHVEDIPFVFGWGFNPEMKDLHSWTQEEREFSKKIMKFWANFAKTGDPSKTSFSGEPGSGEIEWPSFFVPDLYYKELSLDMPVGRGVKADECALWGDFLEDLRLTLVSMEEAELQWRESYSSWQTNLEDWRIAFNSYQKNKNCF
ncbi:Acetylcholinesterase [Holothuria leucospilota]|uniref:Acetylcholinesterase n=1 Tax=Holothuria leucospilota TaxID=206669 RepID=A0A9Q1C0P8_HOLLE|nr:Acetylcholinesterase [Holothuria leucospilota]